MSAPTAARRRVGAQPYQLVTGGAGFIGTNLADRLLGDGHRVLILDNLSRPGVTDNLAWLQRRHGERLRFEQADVRDAVAVGRAVAGASRVFHLAAQVAVTTSLASPLDDFEVNARGSLNLLEAVRGRPSPPPLVFTSTNKVYGALEDLSLQRGPRRYAALEPVARAGIGEDRPLDFHSPYGCSKGTADQYVLDYARSYRLPTVVFRMSCIYGPHQCGSEDQGWIAHFMTRALAGAPLTVYGDGRQVRDVLFATDLVRAFLLALDHIGRTAGRAFNIGGGPEQTLSLVELLDEIERLHGAMPPVRFGAWRQGDQRYYVSDHGRFTGLTGWTPRVGVREGLRGLYQWLSRSRDVAAMRQADQPVAGSLS